VGGTRRGRSTHRVEDDAGLENEHVKVGLRRRIVGLDEARRPMAVPEVARVLLILLGPFVLERRGGRGGRALAAAPEPPHDGEVDAEDEVRASCERRSEEDGHVSHVEPARRREGRVHGPMAMAAAAGSNASSPRQALENMMKAWKRRWTKAVAIITPVPLRKERGRRGISTCDEEGWAQVTHKYLAAKKTPENTVPRSALAQTRGRRTPTSEETKTTLPKEEVSARAREGRAMTSTHKSATICRSMLYSPRSMPLHWLELRARGGVRGGVSASKGEEVESRATHQSPCVCPP